MPSTVNKEGWIPPGESSGQMSSVSAVSHLASFIFCHFLYSEPRENWWRRIYVLCLLTCSLLSSTFFQKNCGQLKRSMVLFCLMHHGLILSFPGGTEFARLREYQEGRRDLAYRLLSIVKERSDLEIWEDWIEFDLLRKLLKAAN